MDFNKLTMTEKLILIRTMLESVELRIENHPEIKTATIINGRIFLS